MFKNYVHSPMLIAEIGGNHEGDFEYAKQLTQLAIASEADAVKFQIYTGDTLVSQLESPTRNQHFKKFELEPEQHIELAKMVIDAGRMYVASVWDVEALDWIHPYISFYKIGSGDVTAYPVLKATASFEKPILLSTGLSEEQEVIDAVQYIQNANPFYQNPNHLAVLQCTSMYPISLGDAHLNVMNQLQQKLQLPIGYSDHTEGSLALETAAAMGAQILEFHFTDTRKDKTFRDHKVSLTCEDVKQLRQKITTIKKLQGEFEKKPLPIEIENGHPISFRRAVYPSRNIEKGEVLNETNLTVLRPCSGIDARHFDELLGKTVNKSVQKHEKLEWSFIQSN